MNISKKFSDVLKNMMVRQTVVSSIVAIVFCIALISFINLSVIRTLIMRYQYQSIDSLEVTMEAKSKTIDEQFLVIKNNVIFMQKEQANFFSNYSEYSIDGLNAEFEIHGNGAYYKTKDNGGSALYYSSVVPFNEYTKDKALRSEWIDTSLKTPVDINDQTIQSYFNSFDHMNRIYPYREDLPLQYGPSVNMLDYNFYYDAIYANNPQKEAVWTSPYFDPAGQGWIVSCIAPIYNGDFLEGVSGVDITLSSIGSNILNIQEYEDAAILLLEPHGVVISQNEMAREMLEFPKLNYINGEIGKTISKSDDFNIHTLKDKELSRSLISAIERNSETLYINGVEYYFNRTSVLETGWHLIALIPLEQVMSEVNILRDNIKYGLVVTIILILIVITITLFIYLRKARLLSHRISDPVVRLTNQIKDFGLTSFDVEPIDQTGIEELDSLSTEFFRMAHDIRTRTNKLLRIQIEKSNTEKTLETYLKEATTDALTGLYNRRKIDDVLDAEVQRANRYHTVFSIMILDVDLFKDVNDRYGHHIGDDILIGFSTLLKENTRSSDFVGRWGGDEFVIITIETKADAARIIAEKVRKAVEQSEIVEDIKVTTSIGIAEYNFELDDSRSLMRKADLALYEAKREGKNYVVTYDDLGEKNEI